jgi:hypothetical protein
MIRRAQVSAIALVVFMFAGCVLFKDYVVTRPSTTGMVGEWQGKVRPFVAWYPHELDFALQIHPDGAIDGRVGDAEITSGRLVAPWNRTEQNYQVQADLEGPLVAAEGIRRKTCVIFVRVEADEMVGQFRANGTMFGGKKSMDWDCDLVEVTKRAP